MKSLVGRTQHLKAVEKLLRERHVVLILGARQVGKTTLARELVRRRRGKAVLFDLEDTRDLARLDEPMMALEPLRGLVVIDEIQHRSELFPVLRVLADRPRCPARFLLLGSASPELLRQGSESLAGRIAFYELRGFDPEEVGSHQLNRLWLRGAFPRSFLARTHKESATWRRDFIRTFLERDLPQLGFSIPSRTLGRFWTMIAHYHGQIWNGSELARAFGVSHTTVRKYLDLLRATFVVRQLEPWSQSLRKRVVRSPKVYVADSGLLHALLSLETPADLEAHPKVGASWEGFALETVVRRLRAEEEQCFFWATHAGAELDLLVVAGSRRFGFEFKRTDAPKVTASMRSALEDLRLDRLDIVHAGKETFPAGPLIRALAATDIVSKINPLR